MERFSPKIEIINHFDDLIQKVDIDIEKKIEKYNDNQLLGELECFKVENRTKIYDHRFEIGFFEFRESSDEIKEQWSESTKVVDYLNQVRMRTIEELRKEQSESVENSSRFNILINSELTKEEKRIQLFADKFYFQVKIKKESRVFNIYTFVTDFYISQFDIDLLENLINKNEKVLIQNDIFDEKMVLIGLLYKYFCENINSKFPNHVIQVFKKDISKIKEIQFYDNIHAVKLNNSSIDLSKLKRLFIQISNAFDYIVIDSLTSLEYIWFYVQSVKEISFKNLYALKQFYLTFYLYEKNVQNFHFDPMPTIEKLSYCNRNRKFVFDKLEKSINVSNSLIFNCDDLILNFFMNNFCDQIEKLQLNDRIENITWLLSNYHFQNLKFSSISCYNMDKLEKKLFDGLSTMIQTLNINANSNLYIIDHDVFFKFKHLVHLNLSENLLQSLDRRLFSGLFNLEVLNLHYNQLKRLDENIFSDLKNLKKLDLSDNQLESLDALFVGLENLNELNLQNIKPEIIYHNLFSDLKQLVSLNLSDNSIESLDKRLFLGLVNLECLYLHSNRFERLDGNIFSNQKNLKKLDLHFTQLKILDAKSFVGLENLNELNLCHNLIESIDQDIQSQTWSKIRMNSYDFV